MSMNLHLSEKPIAEGDTGPQIIFGFTSEQFSQAVYLDASLNAADAVQAADALYKGYLEACGAAVKAWAAKKVEEVKVNGESVDPE